MKKNHVIIIVVVALIFIFVATFILVVNQNKIEKLQSALKKTQDYLINTGTQLTETVNSQKQLEENNQKLIAYIDAKEGQENREPIGFKIERTENTNDKKVNS
jgi:predicted Holliday junction resolvase-like endonuclease